MPSFTGKKSQATSTLTAADIATTVITPYNSRVTSSASTTVSFTSASADIFYHIVHFYAESGPGHMSDISYSPNDSVFNDRYTLNVPYLLTGDANHMSAGFIVDNSAVLKYTTASDVGSYVVVIMGVKYEN